eukprot:SAG31_NODE_42436_length_271_cov_1.354651_1_plen_36_part_10
MPSQALTNRERIASWAIIADLNSAVRKRHVVAIIIV